MVVFGTKISFPDDEIEYSSTKANGCVQDRFSVVCYTAPPMRGCSSSLLLPPLYRISSCKGAAVQGGDLFRVFFGKTADKMETNREYIPGV